MGKADYIPLPQSTTEHSKNKVRMGKRTLSSSLAIVSFLLLATSHAQLLFPDQIPFNPDSPWQDRVHPELLSGSLWKGSSPPKIAIIGAGAGGSSAAYYLGHFGKLGKQLDVDVTIYESSEYVGGRSTVVWPWNEDPYATPEEDEEEPVELGASIFVDANKNLQKAVRIFNLSLQEHGGEEGGMSIWDGEKFVYQESKGWGWGYWDLAKMFWRYGRSPLKVRDLVKTTVGSFLSLYTKPFVSLGAFSSLYDFAVSTNLTHAASLLSSDYFLSYSISPLFTSELIAAATTVNYGSSTKSIHGLGALVSLAANGASSVVGGNRKIFENFVGSSGARIRLGEGAKVTEIVKLDAEDGQRPQWVVKAGAGGGTYDAIILAAPFHQTGIRVVNSPFPSLIPPQPYVNLHVSMILTNATAPSSSYFSQKAAFQTPKAVFASFDTDSVVKPAFNSLNYLKPLPASIGGKFGEGEWHVIKMFSKDTLDMDLLEEVFGAGNVGKKWERVFLAYPQLGPVLFEKDLAPVRPDDGFYYVNGFERLISTMETETVSSFNVVTLLLQDFFGYVAPSSWAEWDDE